MTAINHFYNAFDEELYHPDRKRKRHHRTPFQQDRDRIIYSSSFRRLQAKTQVFFSGEYDFYRTRLTHSIEVSQIGRSICSHLRQNSPYLSNDFYIDSDLVEAICLSHDIGHPPFGHAGESALNRLMAIYGGFEGNAQTLRILTDTLYSTPTGREGLNPTRAFADGVMKYKRLFSECICNGNYPQNHFLYDEQKEVVRFVFDNHELPADLQKTEELNRFRSIECQIMDWADDTAFSVNDVVDGVASGLMTSEMIEKWTMSANLNAHQQNQVDQLLKYIRERSLARNFAVKIGDFIQSCRLEPWDNFMSSVSNRYAFYLHIDPAAKEESMLYSRLSRELVFRSAKIYQLEFKADQILRKMFVAFEEQYLHSLQPRMSLLPADAENMVLKETDIKKRARLICDYLSGMTDVFAVRTYKRLFDPDFGSIGDLI